MWEDDGGIDYEGVSEFKCREVGVERVADEDGAWFENIYKFLLDILQCCGDPFEHLGCDAGVPLLWLAECNQRASKYAHC